MKKLVGLILFVFCTQAFALTLTFDDLPKGSSLFGWEQGFYGLKGSPQWEIFEDSTAPSAQRVLRQSGNAIYSWLVKSDFQMQDGFVEVQLKVISGKEDPEVGLVWHHQDAKNYSYVRINAAEDNVIFYRMRDGKKESIKEAETKIGFNTWHRLRVQFQGSQVEVFFNQKPLLSLRDISFQGMGKIGFFTTADTVSEFDDFQADSLKQK